MTDHELRPEDDRRTFAERFEEAAIAAELETGEREESVEEARSHVMVRIARMGLGFLVVILGIAALPLPGPGWLIIAGGLTILAKDVAWADRLLRMVRRRVPGVPEDGKIPRSSMVTMALITIAAVTASLWWTFGRGIDEVPPGSYPLAEDLGDAGDASGSPLAIASLVVVSDGAWSVSEDGCGSWDLTVSVEELETATVESVDRVDDSTESCVVSPLVDSATLTLHYRTDGVLGWLLADQQVSAVEAADGTRYQVAATG